MNCRYCDQIVAADPAYSPVEAAYDLGSQAPRCRRHWRYICGHCGKPSHFMAVAFCPRSARFYCANCCGAEGRQRVDEPFWAWEYYFRYRSPWSGQWHVALDRLEFEGQHPLLRSAPVGLLAATSPERYLERYPPRPPQWRLKSQPSADELRQSWDRNARRWAAGYTDDGDHTRRYQSDEAMLRLLGDVAGLRVLDAGCGNGYLCRKLAAMGASVVGVELSEELHRMAAEHPRRQGIDYHCASICQMPFLGDGSIAKVVSNFVLMDLPELDAALGEIYRVLESGGVFVAVFSHPCFSCGPAGWLVPAPDSPRLEDRYALMVDDYFHRGPMAAQWGDLDPVISFDRPLRDYWRAFKSAGFRIEDFEEPDSTSLARAELPPAHVRQVMRITHACMFGLRKA